MLPQLKLLLEVLPLGTATKKYLKRSAFKGIDQNIMNNVQFFSQLLFKSSHSTTKVFLKNHKTHRKTHVAGSL